MGTSCSCKSMFSVCQSEIIRNVTISPKSEKKTVKDNSSIQISENTDKHFVLQQYPERYIIIYTSNDDYKILMQELLEINDNNSFIIQEYKDQKENSNNYQEISSQMQCSLNDFKL
ncbi:unnamed protein product [Paramecium sonneborni]|uniref:Uncharacterized protein n=1 Tax=Paramecium sonneborni TaxID=65129 RepID=A0A8S1N9A5_9CILI|nr:unnamed protein product [Paramecium sonneborni]